MAPFDPSPLLEAARGGDRRALARLLSIAERGGDDGRALAASAFAGPGGTTGPAGPGGTTGPAGAWVVGISGAPGAGKSSLVDHLVRSVRRSGDRVAVLAVDPSSPVSGGAVLGDRVRMQAHASDPSVFVRSMASRGARGGLATGALDAVRVLVTTGWPWVLVETVGVGQADVDVGIVADTVVVVVTPDWGDGVQAEKAGLLEVADVLVVNKGDRPGAGRAAANLTAMLELVPATMAWRPPVVTTTATTGEGTPDLWDAVRRHRAWSAGGDRAVARRRARLVAELRRVIEQRAGQAGLHRAEGADYVEVVEAIVAGHLDPAAAADRLLGDPDRA